MFNRKPNISHLCPFRSPVYILDESNSWSKLDPKAVKRTFVGYEDGPWAIQYYDAPTCRVSISQNFTFADELGDTATGIEMDEVINAVWQNLSDKGDDNGDGEGDGKGDGEKVPVTATTEEPHIQPLTDSNTTTNHNNPNHNHPQPSSDTPRTPVKSTTTQEQRSHCTWNVID